MTKSRIDNYIIQQEGLPSLTNKSLQSLQLSKLNSVLKKEKARGGYYSSLPEELSSLSQLQGLPFTSDEDLACNVGNMLLVSQADIQRVLSDATSGTSGKAKRVFYTAEDCESTIGLFMAGLGELIYPDDVTMVCMPFSGAYGLGELICQAIERLGAYPLKLGASLSYKEYDDVMRAEKPNCFVGMPVQLLSILRACHNNSLIRALISGDACPRTVCDECERLLQSKLYPHYGSREMALGGAVSCQFHSGMHIRENHVICEIVNEKGECLPDGEYGELVISTIGMQAMPLIRYKTGDYTCIIPGACPCGSVTRRLAPVIRHGEGLEMLKLDEALFANEWLVDFRASRGEALVIEAIALDSVDLATAKRDIQRSVCEEAEIRIRYLKPEDKALYKAKRSIIRTRA